MIAMDECESRIRDNSVVPDRPGPTMKSGALITASADPTSFRCSNFGVLLRGTMLEEQLSVGTLRTTIQSDDFVNSCLSNHRYSQF